MRGKKVISCLLIAMILAMSPFTNIANFTNTKTSNVMVVNAKTTYPTKWVAIPNQIKTDKKTTKAAKAALATTVVTCVAAVFPEFELLNVKQIIKVFGTATASALLSNYYVNSDVQNVYYTASYYYRETGPNKTDSQGNVTGQYEVKIKLQSFSDKKRTKIIATTIDSYKTTTMANLLEYLSMGE